MLYGGHIYYRFLNFRYEILPTELYFGQQLVDTDQELDLHIRNLGKYDFNYNVISMKQIMAQKEKKKGIISYFLL